MSAVQQPNRLEGHASVGAATAAEREIEHVFSVDVEEYFHAHAMERVAPVETWESLPWRVDYGVNLLLQLLSRHRATATFFTLGWIAERHPALIRRIADAGHEIASHGWWHRRVASIGREAFRQEARRSKAVLEDVAGQAVRGHRAPSFSILPGSEWAFDILLEEGYAYDSSLFPIRRPGYGYPAALSEPFEIRRESGTLLELPMTTTRVGSMRIPAAGGAYFRVLPYALTRSALRSYASRGIASMFYVHPWELDVAQPRLPVGRLTRIRHYRGIAGTTARLERLMREFRFASISRVHGPRLRASPRAGLSMERA